MIRCAFKRLLGKMKMTSPPQETYRAIDMQQKIIQRLLNDQKHIRVALSELLTNDLIDQIIWNLISERDIQESVYEEMLEYMGQHPEQSWDLICILCSFGLTYSMHIEQNPSTGRYVPDNTGYTNIKAITDLDYCIYISPGITRRPVLEMTWNEYKEIPMRQSGWFDISMEPDITIEMIERHLEKPWNWCGVSMNPNITMGTIDEHPEIPWRWDWISRNPNVTIEYIETHMEKPWNWYRISCHPNLTMEMIEKHPGMPWDWVGISKNPNITMEMIVEHPEKPWHWYGISKNPNLTMDIVEKYLGKPWDWKGISLNTNLTLEMMEKHTDKKFSTSCMSYIICQNVYSDAFKELEKYLM